jgi:hypothetical protein
MRSAEASLQVSVVLSEAAAFADDDARRHLRLDVVAWQILMQLRNRLPLDLDQWNEYLKCEPFDYDGLDALYQEGTLAQAEALRLVKAAGNRRLLSLRKVEALARAGR